MLAHKHSIHPSIRCRVSTCLRLSIGIYASTNSVAQYLFVFETSIDRKYKTQLMSWAQPVNRRVSVRAWSICFHGRDSICLRQPKFICVRHIEAKSLSVILWAHKMSIILYIPCRSVHTMHVHWYVCAVHEIRFSVRFLLLALLLLPQFFVLCNSGSYRCSEASTSTSFLYISRAHLHTSTAANRVSQRELYLFFGGGDNKKQWLCSLLLLQLLYLVYHSTCIANVSESIAFRKTHIQYIRIECVYIWVRLWTDE